MSFLDYFIGTAQSKYAAMAIFAAIVVLCISVLVTNTEISLGNRVAVVFFILVMSIFPVAVSLFELTCIVTGGKKGSAWSPCNMFAWLVAIMIVVYCFILIIMTVMSMFSYKKALDKVTVADNLSKISSEDAEKIAQNIIKEHYSEKKNDFYEMFENAPKDEQRPADDQGLKRMRPIREDFIIHEKDDEPVVIQPNTQAKPESNVDGFDASDNLMDVRNEFEKVAELPESREVKPKFSSGDSEPEAFTSRVVENFSPF